MKTINLNTGDWLIIDPCYIKGVYEQGETSYARYDGLRCVRVIHDGDDGMFDIDIKPTNGVPADYVYTTITPTSTLDLGVDSGRIWLLKAEFPVTVVTSSGYSGEIAIKNPDKHDDINVTVKAQ